MSAVEETLAESEIYPLGGSTTSEVLSWEDVISSMTSRPKGSVRIRIQAPLPNRALIGTVVKLIALRNLSVGWDSYGAQPIHAGTIQRAVELIPSLFQASTPQPDVVPQVGGGLQLEWHRKGVDLEIYFDSPDDIHFAAEDRNSGEEVERPLWQNEELLRRWIARVSD